MQDRSLSKLPSTDLTNQIDIGFEGLCKKYVNNVYESKINFNHELPISAFAEIEKILFKITNAASIKDLIKEIHTDAKFLKKLKNHNDIVYFSPHNTFSSPLVKRKIKSSVKSPNISFEITCYSEIINYLHSNNGLNDYKLISKSDLEYLYRNTVNPPQKSIYIIDEIVNYVFKENHGLISENKKTFSLSRLKNKISVNFGPPEWERIRDYYLGVWETKEIFEKFVINNFDSKRQQLFSIRAKIQKVFSKHNFFHEIETPVNYKDTISIIAESLVPPGKENLESYLIVSEAIVLYFFEYCDFGLKSQNEEPSLFQQYLDEHQ